MSKETGEIPSTQEITRTLETAKQQVEEAKKETPGLDTTGKKILEDTGQVLKTAEQFIAEKNRDEKFQQLIKEGQKASEELAQHAERLRELQSETLNKIDSDRLRRLAEETLRTARLAGMEIISSPSFRKNLMDILQLLSEIVGETVQQATGMEPQRVEAGPSTGPSVTAGPSVTTGQVVETGGKGLYKSVEPTAGELRGRSMWGETTTGERMMETGEKQKMKQPFEKMKEGEGPSREEVKEGAEGAVNLGLQALGSERRVTLSDEQVDRLFDRFNDLLREINKRERTQQVFRGISEIFRLLKEQSEEAGEHLKETLQQTTEQISRSEHFNKALKLAQEVFEQFTGKQSLDTLINRFKNIKNILRDDPETRKLFNDFSDYFSRALEEPTRLQDRQFIDEGKVLIRRARDLHDRKIYHELVGARDELRKIVDAIESDPLTLKLRDDMKKLVSDIMLDKDGNVVWKPEVLEQLRLIITSFVLERLRIPIPAVHFEDDTMELTLSGLVLSLKELVPEKVTVESRAKIELDFAEPQQPEVQTAGHGLRVTLQNIHLHMPSADIWFRRKTFPKIEDEGRATLDIGGRGMDIVIILRTQLRTEQLFRVTRVDCNVHDLSFSLSDTSHDFLYNTLFKLFLSQSVKNTIENSIENTIMNQLEYLNELLSVQVSKVRELSQQQGMTTSFTEAIKQGVSQTIGTAY